MLLFVLLLMLLSLVQARYCVKFRPKDGELILKVTDDYKVSSPSLRPTVSRYGTNHLAVSTVRHTVPKVQDPLEHHPQPFRSSQPTSPPGHVRSTSTGCLLVLDDRIDKTIRRGRPRYSGRGEWRRGRRGCGDEGRIDRGSRRKCSDGEDGRGQEEEEGKEVMRSVGSLVGGLTGIGGWECIITTILRSACADTDSGYEQFRRVSFFYGYSARLQA